MLPKQQHLWRAKHCLLWLILLLSMPASYANQDIVLPDLGGSSSMLFSIEQEQELGQDFLRAFHAQSNYEPDYLVKDYIEELLYQLRPYSNYPYDNLDLILIPNPSLNAFAVPGGIVGVHTGLLEHAESEHQLASVLAHELGHLSQRHFSRRIEVQKNNRIKTMAGVLAGILLAASGEGDAGIALTTASQAASIQSALAYSRQHEQEADRLGIATLAQAGFDPMGAPNMFEKMLRRSEFTGRRIPEYLRSHPLTESRISDARARAEKYAKQYYPESKAYPYIRLRVLLERAVNNKAQLEHYKSLAEQTSQTRYAQAILSVQLGLVEQAQHLAKQLRTDNNIPEIIRSHLLASSIGMTQPKQALTDLERDIQRYPDSLALRVLKAQLQEKAHLYQEASETLTFITQTRPNEIRAWYNLAELEGLAGNLYGVHTARAEYFSRVGAYDTAIRQLRYAKRETNNDPIKNAIIDIDIERYKTLRDKKSIF